MRVLMVCDPFFKHAVRIVEGLREEGAEVLVLARNQTFEFGGQDSARAAYVARVRAAGGEVLDLPFQYRDPSAARVLVKCRKVISDWAPDVVHAQDEADLRALPFSAGLPVILTVHDPVPHPDQPVPAFWPARQALRLAKQLWRRRADLVVVHGNALREELRRSSSHRRWIEVVPHGIHVAEGPSPAPTHPTIGFFGRLERYKGLHILDNALLEVWHHRPEVKALIVGNGEYPSALTDGRLEKVERYIGDHEIRPLIARMTLIALPYIQASQSGPGTIAAGLGIPAVVTRVGGLPEIVLDDTYIAIPADVSSLALALLAHVDDGDDVRRRVWAEIAGPRSWRSVARRYLALYERCLRVTERSFSSA